MTNGCGSQIYNRPFEYDCLPEAWNILDKKYANTMLDDALWPLLLTWFNFNPSMDK